MPARAAEEVLAAWRDVERQLEAATPGSPDEERLVAQAAALRDEYQRLVDEAKAQQAASGEPLTAN